MDRIGKVIELAGYAAKQPGSGPRMSRCEMCDELHHGTSYICPACMAKHRNGLRVKAQKRMVDSVPMAYRECRFGFARLGFLTAAHIGAVRSSSSRGLAITGPAGAGKTTLAVAKLFDLFDGGMRSCMFVSAPDLARARAIYPLGDGEAPLVGNALRATALIIDDLGKERQDIAGAVSDVIFARHAQGKKTIVTTGLGFDAARSRYDDGIARRLFEEDWVILGGKP